jgi:hypothetical protein
MSQLRHALAPMVDRTVHPYAQAFVGVNPMSVSRSITIARTTIQPSVEHPRHAPPRQGAPVPEPQLPLELARLAATLKS